MPQWEAVSHVCKKTHLEEALGTGHCGTSVSLSQSSYVGTLMNSILALGDLFAWLLFLLGQ